MAHFSHAYYLRWQEEYKNNAEMSLLVITKKVITQTYLGDSMLRDCICVIVTALLDP